MADAGRPGDAQAMPPRPAAEAEGAAARAGGVHIRVDDLRGAQVARFLQTHLDDMRRHSPPQSVHALDLDRLRRPDITFWTAWDGDALLGCAALKALDDATGEVNSMRTAPAQRNRGVASALLRQVLDAARARGYRQLLLETGSPAAFAPARALYARFGFVACGPFADYTDDPWSVFMALELAAGGGMR